MLSVSVNSSRIAAGQSLSHGPIDSVSRVGLVLLKESALTPPPNRTCSFHCIRLSAAIIPFMFRVSDKRPRCRST